MAWCVWHRAKADAERRVQGLIDHGTRYAEQELREFASADRSTIRDAVKEDLKKEVEADWDEADVEDLVDDVLGEFEDPE